MHRFSSLAIALCAGSLSAQVEFWVDPVNGSNFNSGSFTQPLQTLTQACMLAGSGDRIHLLPGTYGPGYNGEVLPITVGAGVTQSNMVVRGIGSVVFDLGGSTLPALRFATGASGIRVTNITFTNSDQLNWWTRVINSGTGVNTANAATDVEIDRCRFININRAFVLWTADNVQRWHIHDNLFANCTNDAILEYAGDNDIYNNTFHTNTWKAYISDSTTSRCFNNLVVGCNIAFENNNAASNLQRYQNNWIFQCTTPTVGAGLASGLPASNTIGVDPLLASPLTGDFRLQAGSPCIDAGTAAIAARADLDANSRVVDFDQNGSLLPDVGCHEQTPVSMTASHDPLLRLITVSIQSTPPGTWCFVVFSFDDGLVQVPGQGPILIDINTFIPAQLFGMAPNTWVLNLNSSPPFFPGQRLVMQVLGLGTVPSLLGGNQVWLQL